jgi:hypothetical protein
MIMISPLRGSLLSGSLDAPLGGDLSLVVGVLGEKKIIASVPRDEAAACRWWDPLLRAVVSCCCRAHDLVGLRWYIGRSPTVVSHIEGAVQ